MAEGRFVLVYHEDLIANHAPIWDDDKTLATWLRLLALADRLWPTPAELPRGVSKAAVERLIGSGLIEMQGRDRFHFPSLDRRRTAQSNAASNAARIRHGTAQSNATAMRDPMPTKTSTRRDEDKDAQREARANGPEKVAAILPDAFSNDPIPVDVRRLQKLAEELTQIPYVMANPFGGWAKKAVEEQLPHGYERVERAWRTVANQTKGAGSSKPTLRQLVLGADDLLNPVPHQDAKDARDDAAREAYDRRVAKTQQQIAEYRRHMGTEARSEAH